MNKTKIYKIIYILIIVFFIAGFIYLELMYNLPFYVKVIIIIILLIPGRITGYFYRNFFTGMKFFNESNWVESEKYFKIFLDDLAKRLWIKKMIWCLWGFYTRDIEAMTHNNLGAIYIETGKLNDAEQQLKKAIDFDKKYPKPYYNLALLEFIKDNKQNSNDYFQESVKLGFSNNAYDQIISKGQKILAQIESK